MSDPKPKRRLPVLQSAADDDAAEERPPWQWCAIGAVSSLLAWILLASVAGSIAGAVVRHGDDGAAPGAPESAGFLLPIIHAVGLALAGFLGGLLVGRFGGRAGRREAGLSGVAAAIVAWALAAAQPGIAGPGALGWTLALAALGAIGGGSALAGGHVGVRLRARGRTFS